MHGITAALVGALVGCLSLAATAGPAPDPEAEIAACKQRCTEGDETDRATCRLNCEEATDEKDRAHIIRWTEERHVGGVVPGQDAPPPPTTTVTKVTPRGTIVETNAPAAPAAKAAVTTATAPTARTPRQRYYFGLVDCQDGCNGVGVDLDRARCKLQCLRGRPGPPPPPTAAARPAELTSPPVAEPMGDPAIAPSRPASQRQPAAKASPTPAVDCKARCAHETIGDDRSTCEASCSYAQERKAGANTTVEKTTVITRPAQCRDLCAQQGQRCRDGCTGGADGSTCRVQCDESADTCTRRCH